MLCQVLEHTFKASGFCVSKLRLLSEAKPASMPASPDGSYT